MLKNLKYTFEIADSFANLREWFTVRGYSEADSPKGTMFYNPEKGGMIFIPENLSRKGYLAHVNGAAFQTVEKIGMADQIFNF